jgi:glycosyltransferase involved in cell wall biosynthesis
MVCAASITALVPVYNEVMTVGASVRQIHSFLASLPNPFDILVIESGSSDGTAQACDALADELPTVVVVHEGSRNGFGAALRLGFAKATKDLIWVIPVDLPYSLSVLTEALEQIPVCDAVLSTRRTDARSAFRRLQSRVYTSLCAAVLGQPLLSPNSAFKLYRREVLKSLPISSNGWFIDTEIACRLRQRKCRVGIVEIDTVERSSGQSTVTALDSWRMLRQLLAFRKTLIDENRNRRAS